MAQDGDDAGTDAAEAARIDRILSGLEQSEAELLDPPATVWAGIAASIAKEPPARDTPTHMVVEYWIDGDDIVCEVGEGWAGFANDNDAPELVAPPADRTLWDQMAPAEVVDLWRSLVERVRTMGAEANVPFRCDGPDARRWFEMTLSPAPDGRVRFRSVLAFEELRPRVALLDPRTGRDDDARPVALCSWCGRGDLDGDWLDVEELVRSARLLERPFPPALAHGICAACRRDMAAELVVPGRDQAGA